jgi:DNA-directed RNA polymerase specialized sigma24 family protein
MIRRNGHGDDPAEAVGRVLTAKREALLRAYRHRVVREDLEDCLSQAALELVGRARRGGLRGDGHIANALEQKFASRIADRQRTMTARGIASAPSGTARLWSTEAPDPAASADSAAASGDPAEALALREDLGRIREVAAELTDDQRLVLACQVSLGMEAREFCERFGWSAEKFRKVAQPARAALRVLLAEYELGERCARLEDDLVAYAAGTASAHRELMVRGHIANCVGCAAFVRECASPAGGSPACSRSRRPAPSPAARAVGPWR